MVCWDVPLKNELDDDEVDPAVVVEGALFVIICDMILAPASVVELGPISIDINRLLRTDKFSSRDW